MWRFNRCNEAEALQHNQSTSDVVLRMFCCTSTPSVHRSGSAPSASMPELCRQGSFALPGSRYGITQTCFHSRCPVSDGFAEWNHTHGMVACTSPCIGGYIGRVLRPEGAVGCCSRQLHMRKVFANSCVLCVLYSRQQREFWSRIETCFVRSKL